MVLAKEQEGRFNKAAADYLAGHGRNFLRSMNPRNTEPLEKVPSWSETRAAALNPTPQVAAAPEHAPGAALRGGTQPPPGTGQPTVPVLTGQSKAAPGATTTVQPQAAQQPAFQSLLGNGMTMTGDMQGNRTYTMGTPGQDGYGKMVVPGGQNAMAAQNLSGARPQAQSPYSFDGSSEDRARFMQQPTQPAIQDGNTVSPQRAAYLQVRDRAETDRAAREQLAGLDPRSGWGWKGRRELYLANRGLDQRSDEEQNRTAIEAARMLAGQNQANAALAEQRRQFDEQAPGRQADLEAKQHEVGFSRQKQAVLDRLDATEDPEERRVLTGQLLAMQGKEPPNKYQVVTREEIDPVTRMPIKTPMVIDPNNPARAYEVRGQGAMEADAAMSVINGNPRYQEAYRAASPEQQAEMLRKVRERIAQGGGQ